MSCFVVIVANIALDLEHHRIAIAAMQMSRDSSRSAMDLLCFSCAFFARSAATAVVDDVVVIVSFCCFWFLP